MNIRRSVLGAALGGAAIAVVTAGIAWSACLGAMSPPFIAAEDDAARAASSVAITGKNWQVGEEVTINWQGVGVLATVLPADDHTLAVDIKVPDVAPGAYAIQAVQGTSRSGINFDVVDPAPTVGLSGNASAPSATPPAPAAGSTSLSVVGGPGDATQLAADDALPVPTPVAVITGQPSSASAAVAPATSGGIGEAPVVEITPAVPAVADGPAPVVEPPAPASAAMIATMPTPLAGTVTGDLWSGFAPGRASGPGLLDVEPLTQGQPLPVAGLVGAGIAALLAGFGIAELRRRPAAAGHSTDKA